MKKLGLILLVFFLAINVSCRKEIPSMGYVDVDGGKVWYKIVGDGPKTPLLILHGGPGGRSCYMIPGLSLLAKDRSVIFYDQLGSGSSERPNDTLLWTTERFVNEIDYIRKSLKLKKLHILGHSAGSTFLIEYMVTKKPKGVKSVIFSSPMISTKDWIADANILLSKLPSNIKDTIYKYEALKEYSSPAYRKATSAFYDKHLNRKKFPWLACYSSGYRNSNIYNYMWGPTEFKAIGTLLDFDRTGDLDMITEPILFVTGEYDEARPETMYKYQKLSKNARVEIISDAAHMTMIDQPEKLAEAIGELLNRIDNNK